MFIIEYLVICQCSDLSYVVGITYIVPGKQKDCCKKSIIVFTAVSLHQLCFNFSLRGLL